MRYAHQENMHKLVKSSKRREERKIIRIFHFTYPKSFPPTKNKARLVIPYSCAWLDLSLLFLCIILFLRKKLFFFNNKISLFRISHSAVSLQENGIWLLFDKTIANQWEIDRDLNKNKQSKCETLNMSLEDAANTKKEKKGSITLDEQKSKLKFRS